MYDLLLRIVFEVVFRINFRHPKINDLYIIPTVWNRDELNSIVAVVSRPK